MISQTLKENESLQRGMISKDSFNLDCQEKILKINRMTFKQTGTGRAERGGTLQVIETAYQKYLCEKGV